MLPPPQIPSILVKAKNAYSLWFNILNDFPRVRRYSLGAKIEHYFLALLESIFISLYLTPEKKIEQLTIAIAKLDGIKLFLQLAWENKCISQDKYINLSEQLNETGRMLGGWKKGLQKKTPAK